MIYGGTFIIIPRDRQAQSPESAWRIRLSSTRLNGTRPMMVEVRGESMLGINTPQAIIDLDFRAYDGYEYGVSRCHALLMPTPALLYVMDMNSTNGTFINNHRIAVGQMGLLHDGDILTLGNLHLRLDILSRPII